MEIPVLRVTTSAALKEKRLSALLAEREAGEARAAEAMESAQVIGSLALAGIEATEDDVRAARAGSGPGPVRGLLAARRAVAAAAPLTVSALAAWHDALGVAERGFRTTERPDAPASAPVEFIESRLSILEQWLSAESRRQLKPAQAGALALARLMEILPFQEGNGRVARLAASHLMVQGGARPPILIGADGPRLAEATQAAFQLVTEPLARLLDEASERGLDVMIRALE